MRSLQGIRTEPGTCIWLRQVAYSPVPQFHNLLNARLMPFTGLGNQCSLGGLSLCHMHGERGGSQTLARPKMTLREVSVKSLPA